MVRPLLFLAYMTARLVKVSVLVLVGVFASGCAMRGRGKNVAFVANGAAIAGGATMLAGAASQECEEFSFGFCESTKASMTGLGVVLVAAGLIGVFTNMAINAKKSDESKRPPAGFNFSARTHADGPPGATVAGASTYDQCPDAVQHWRSERDPRKKNAIFRAIWPRCRTFMLSLIDARVGAQ